MTEHHAIDVNRAGREQLTALPGVGEKLAERIIARRPYERAEELLDVPGIGPSVLERLRPRLTFQPASTAPAAPAAAQEAERRSVPAAPAEAAQAASRRWALWLSLGTGLASVLIAIVLSLAILAGINGSLSVERNASVRALNGRVSAAEDAIGNLGAGVDSIETRLQAFEGLSGRMTALETDFAAMRGELDAARAELDGMQSSLADMAERVSVFDAFLFGIQDILQEILPQQPLEVP